MAIMVRAQDKRILPGDVYFMAELRNGEIAQGPLDKNWLVQVDTQDIEILNIFAKNHWSLKFEGAYLATLEPNATINLSPIIDADWWKKAIINNNISLFTKNIRIGIADCGFHRPDSAFVQYDVNGREANTSRYRSASHGSRVAGIIDGRLSGQGAGGGLIANPQIEFIDVGKYVQGFELWDSSKIPVAITLLSEDFDVNLINLSGGLFAADTIDSIPELNSTAVIRDSIEEAYDIGVVCICAVGNKAQHSIFYPASDDLTVGVGAVGRCGLSPVPNLGALYEDQARALGLLERVIASPLIYVSPENSRGRGLDCLAPGVALPLSADPGELYDYTGSSYATPVVTAALAYALDNDVDYWSRRGRSRSDYVRNKLISICDDLGLESDVQGYGLIRIKC